MFGEALMRHLRAALSDAPDHETELEAIGRVEYLMGLAIADALPGRDKLGTRRAADARAAEVASRFTDWRSFVLASLPALVAPLERFRQMEIAAPRALKDLMRLLTVHEEMLAQYLERSAAGTAAPDNDALAGIENALRAYLVSHDIPDDFQNLAEKGQPF
ncbi:hypothetical protein SAMN05518849_12349 [Sphingobium sp. AP50]|uniref:hypothetical protein n=1 Tax=Sphingobium sp. AP50 TaxID=1884369 RepID=UPI0008D0AB97|nr:hypothetical protein [Sphingobium sp. AP50]SEJ98859.1 hypothetical protein SAMN05518849_12349 [Sphingobium sp. AP50]